MDKIRHDRKTLFQDCEFFIDYVSSQTGCDRSLRLGNELEKKYAAKIVERPHPTTTTHLIFKNGNLQTKVFAQKHRIPLLDPLWLESSIRRRRLLSFDNYRVPFDENQDELNFHRLTIEQNNIQCPSTPKTQFDNLKEKKNRKILYTPNRDELEQENPHEYFQDDQRRITLDQLGFNFNDEEHQFIHRYGCSVARRQNPRPPIEQQVDSPCQTNELIPSQSQSSPRIHFAQEIRPEYLRSLSSSIDFSSERPSILLGDQPQSTPKSSPILRPQRPTTNEQSLTKVTPIREKSPEKETIRDLPRPPPLLALSQRIRQKHPEQLLVEPVVDPFPSIEDLPISPANYSFVFYQFSPTQVEEAKRLTRRMGDCFALENLDITTTHLILVDDDPQLNINFDFLLGILSGCRLVTFEWLKASAKIGEWLNGNSYEPRRLFQSIPSLNFYRKSRQQNQPIELFHQSGRIYLTSLVKQRANLLKLILLLGGNVTVNRNQANIVIGISSKTLPVQIYPQVTEQWVLDSIVQGQCLPTDNYLLQQ